MITPTKEFWAIFKETNGALSTAEALAIMNIAAQAPQGRFLELGSHKGKSSLSISFSMPSISSLNLVEPEFENIEWENEVRSKVEKYYNNVHCFASYSPAIISIFDELSFCFVDSSIHDDMVMDEVKALEDRIVPNGIIAFHDYLNQFTAVERAYNYLVGTGKYEPIPINWQEIFDYVAEHNLEEGNNSWHQYPELPHPPNFVGAVKRK